MPSIAGAPARPRDGLARLARQTARLAGLFGLAMQVRRERRALMRLDRCALKDMGFSSGEASVEASRSFWDLPRDRLQV
ncbi:MAG: hypothetical protein F9K29_16400 [Hyphomicrobiaceae bacterium]|nr:MAG: hypothetical protein F9K29_16400 [Hyphomicrobiaceae bacterium]